MNSQIIVKFALSRATEAQNKLLEIARSSRRDKRIKTLGGTYIVTYYLERGDDVQIGLSELACTPSFVQRDVSTGQPVNLTMLPGFPWAYEHMVEAGWTDARLVQEGFAKWA